VKAEEHEFETSLRSESGGRASIGVYQKGTTLLNVGLRSSSTIGTRHPSDDLVVRDYRRRRKPVLPNNSHLGVLFIIDCSNTREAEGGRATTRLHPSLFGGASMLSNSWRERSFQR